MNVRILHCGKSLVNYDLCIKNKIVGFTRTRPDIGDIIYLAFKKDKISYCGARGRIAETTDEKPWPDSDRYKYCYYLDKIEFCNYFDIKILSTIGGDRWALKYVQISKAIKDDQAVNLLNDCFINNKIDGYKPFSNIETEKEDDISISESDDEEDTDIIAASSVEDKINIMGTFQTINFKNETDKLIGLETLVNDNFYSLFPQYPENRAILIDENRLFITSGFDKNDIFNPSGIRGIPDALLLCFSKNSKIPFQVNLIEYECYGESKIKSQDKSNYFNGHIIPQLMRFASTFSIVTEKHIRENTINQWSDKIISYIYQDTILEDKITKWIFELDSNLKSHLIGLKIKELIVNSFKSNLKIILIIDELSSEQRDTITNIIKAFKLENKDSILFASYVVRLEQKINIINGNAEYALSVQ